MGSDNCRYFFSSERSIVKKDNNFGNIFWRGQFFSDIFPSKRRFVKRLHNFDDIFPSKESVGRYLKEKI